MNKKSHAGETGVEGQADHSSALAEVLEGQIEMIINCLHHQGCAKSRLYEEVIALVEQGMLKIALRRSNNVKTNAASFLGINRNTFQKKLLKLGLDNNK